MPRTSQKLGCRVIYPGQKRVIIVKNDDNSQEKRKNRKQPRKKGPKTFLVRIENSKSKHYKGLLQGVEFPKGKVYVAYDAWRMLSSLDSSSDDETNAWFSDMETMLQTGNYSLVATA